MTTSRRACPVTGCNVPVPSHRFMCLGHWRRVPKRLQREVIEAWSFYRRAMADGDGGICDARRSAIAMLRSAQDAALKAVEDKLK